MAICALCKIPDTIAHDASQGVSACTICGTISKEASSEHFVVLGRTLEDEEHEAGRNYLRNGGIGYVGNVPKVNGRSLKGEGDVSVYQSSQLNRTEKLMRVLLTHFHLESLFERAKVIFHQCRQIGQFQWGKKANVFAAASCYVATREREMSIALKEIAELAEVDTHQLVRAHLQIKAWLEITTRELDAISYLERIIVHLSRFLLPSPPPSKITPKNLVWLRSIDLSRARSLSITLVDMISKAADKLITGRQPENIAAATVLLCLEAVARTKAPIQIEFQNEVAKELGIKSYTISERYREIANLLGDKREEIPWLATGDGGSAGGTKGKSKGKTKKKEVVEDAGDIIIFWASVAAKKMKDQIKSVREELDEGEEDEPPEDDDSEILADPLALAPPGRKRPPSAKTWTPTRASASTYQVPQEYSNSSWIGPPSPPPQSTPDPDTATSTVSLKRPGDYRRVRPGIHKRTKTIGEVAQGLSHSLTPASTTSFGPKIDPLPTITSFSPHDPQSSIARRQLLARNPIEKILSARRAASLIENSMEEKRSRLDLLLLYRSAEEIDDEELFDEGELEGFLRSHEEVEKEMEGERYSEIIAWESRPQKEKRKGKVIGRGRRKVKSPSTEEDDEGAEGGMIEAYFEDGPKTKMNEEMRRRLKEVLDEEEGEEVEEGDEEMRLGLGAVLVGDVDIEGLEDKELETEDDE